MHSVVIGGLQKSSLIDYPGKISAIIFTQGCNFRCPYCHNPELIIESGTANKMAVSDLLEFLKTRIGKLDGVVITGGEPTLHKGLIEFVKQIKDLGFLVKLDTNGTNPEMLKTLIDEKLVDYVAMDIKAPIETYKEIVCANVDTAKIIESIELVKLSGLGYEFRTTVVKSLLEPSDFEKIGEMIKGAEKYYLQKFVPTKTLNKTFLGQTTYSDEEFEVLIKILEKYINTVEVR